MYPSYYIQQFFINKDLRTLKEVRYFFLEEDYDYFWKFSSQVKAKEFSGSNSKDSFILIEPHVMLLNPQKHTSQVSTMLLFFTGFNDHIFHVDH